MPPLPAFFEGVVSLPLKQDEDKIRWECLWVEIGKSPTHCYNRQNRSNVRNKTYCQLKTEWGVFLPRLNLTASFSIALFCFPNMSRRMRSRGCSWCFISASVSSTHSSSTPVWELSHAIQPFKNSSNRSPSHRLHLFKNCSSMGSLPWGMVQQEQTDPVWATLGLYFLPENVLQLGCLLHRTSTCSGMGFSIGGSVDIPLQSSMGSRGTTWSTMITEEFLLWCLEHLFLSPWCQQRSSHVFFFILHTAVQHFGFC